MKKFLLVFVFDCALGQHFRYIKTENEIACKNACLLDLGNFVKFDIWYYEM